MALHGSKICNNTEQGNFCKNQNHNVYLQSVCPGNILSSATSLIFRKLLDIKSEIFSQTLAKLYCSVIMKLIY